MRYRAVWISDLHIGTRACKSELLHSFLKQLETEKLYLVGDIFDGWALKSSWYWPPTHNEVVRQIMKLARETKVYYIPGNHDEAVRSFCPLNFGSIEVLTHAVHTTANGKRLIILHGDIFDAFVSNLKHVTLIGNIAYDALIELNNLHHWCLDKLGMKYWSLSDFIKSRARGAIRAVQRFEDAAVQYAKNKNFDGIVCGHIHSASIKAIDGIAYLNDGDWVESCTALAEDFDGNIHLINWAEKLRTKDEALSKLDWNKHMV